MHGRLLAAAAFLAVALAAPADAVTIYATDGTSLVVFDSATPSTVSAPAAITGLGGEALVGIDTDPNSGVLYGYSDADKLYSIAPDTGAATLVGPLTPTAGVAFGMDFDPTVDLFHLVSDTEENFRFNASAGAQTPGPSATPAGSIVGLAYDDNYADAASTTLFGIDSVAGMLLQTTTPADAAFTSVGGLGLTAPFDTALGFDIAGDGTAYAAIRSGLPPFTRFYSVDLATGTTSPTQGSGEIGGGATPYVGIAAKAFDVVNMANATASVTEGQTVNLVVNRAGPTDAGLDVNWTATGDVTSSGQTVVWPAANGTPKTISIPVPDDSTDEPNGSFTVTLVDENGLVISNPTTTVTILDNDDPPVVTPPTQTQTQTTPAPPPPTQTTPTTPRPVVTPRPNPRPQLTVSRLSSRKLSDLTTRRGLTVKVKSNEACKLTAELRIPRSTSKKLIIGMRIARTTARLQRNKQATVKLRPVVQIRNKLKRLRSVKATVWLTCADNRGDADPPKTVATTLRR